jgi:hypothetical protein
MPPSKAKDDEADEDGITATVATDRTEISMTTMATLMILFDDIGNHSNFRDA